MTVTTQLYGLGGHSLAELRHIAALEPMSSWYSADEKNRFFARQEAARILIKRAEEKRRQEIASDQLKGLIAGPLSSYDHEGLATRAVGLADALIAALDARG